MQHTQGQQTSASIIFLYFSSGTTILKECQCTLNCSLNYFLDFNFDTYLSSTPPFSRKFLVQWLSFKNAFELAPL